MVEEPGPRPTLPATPITLRLGRDLAPEVNKRLPVLDTPGAVIRRDLRRYYAGCAESLARCRFDFHEGNILVDLLSNCTLDAANARFLWAEFDEQVRLRLESGYFQKDAPDYERAQGLIGQLRRLSPLDAIAVLDAIETYWGIYYYTRDGDQAMLECGLVYELSHPTSGSDEPSPGDGA